MDSIGSEIVEIAADLTREQLHKLVWERPLNRVGPDLGLDGPRLAKLCSKRNVPYPRPGYWSKKAAGRAPAPTPLPPEEDSGASMGGRREHARASTSSGETKGRSHTSRSLAAAKSGTSAPRPLAPVEMNDELLDNIEELHPKIRALIAVHKRTQKERAQEERRHRHGLWSWSEPLLDDLTPRDLYRLRACSTLCHALEHAGERIKDANIHGKLTFTVQGRDIECAVKEKMTRPNKQPEGSAAKWTAYPHAHNSGLAPSGFLRAQITTWLPGSQPQWIETPKRTFSSLVPQIVATLIASIPRLIEWERQREEDRRRYEAEQRRRWELQRLQEIDDSRWNRFRAAATNWREKELLDAFISELEERLPCADDQSIGKKTAAEWILWAKKRAAALDPFAEGPTGLLRDIAGP